MTNDQTKLIAAAIVFGLGAVALAVGVLALARPHLEDFGPVPGVIAMATGLWLGVHALKRMAIQEDKPDVQ
jgi:tellurite resistance protein TehA-like permease